MATITNVLIPTTTAASCYHHLTSLRKQSSSGYPLLPGGSSRVAAGVCQIRSCREDDVAKAAPLKIHDDHSLVRRSANYQPPNWDFNFIHSLSGDKYEEERYKGRADELKVEIQKMLQRKMMPGDQLKLIDNLERLGISYHFDHEIKRILISLSQKSLSYRGDLYSTALQFRLLRQHGFHVSQDVFDSFKLDEEDRIDSNLRTDTKGLLQWYEATYLATKGETSLELARKILAKHLREAFEGDHHMTNKTDDQYLGSLVHHALELPLHWTMPMLEARWFIDMYEKTPDANPSLLELAKINFNLVQRANQQDLKDIAGWWKEMCFIENFTYTRDRIVEAFFWTIGIIPEPQYRYCRKMLSKVIAFITTIDDTYDIYASLEELELFTSAIERYMGAKSNGDTSSLYPDLLRFAGTIIRLSDDLGTSLYEMKRGDVAKSVQCCMNENGASEEEAREHIRVAIGETWERMNGVVREAESEFSPALTSMAVNFVRASLCMYEHGDGHGIQNPEIRQRMSSLLFEPIPIL